jgi:hypothetical protein
VPGPAEPGRFGSTPTATLSPSATARARGGSARAGPSTKAEKGVVAGAADSACVAPSTVAAVVGRHVRNPQRDRRAQRRAAIRQRRVADIRAGKEMLARMFRVEQRHRLGEGRAGRPGERAGGAGAERARPRRLRRNVARQGVQPLQHAPGRAGAREGAVRGGRGGFPPCDLAPQVDRAPRLGPEVAVPHAPLSGRDLARQCLDPLPHARAVEGEAADGRDRAHRTAPSSASHIACTVATTRAFTP